MTGKAKIFSVAIATVKIFNEVRRKKSKSEITNSGLLDYKIACSGTAVRTRDLAATAAIKLYPVPATDVLFVEDLAPGYTDYFMRDLTGRTILSGRLTEQTINLSSVGANGMFLLSFTGEGKPVLTRKVMVQR